MSSIEPTLRLAGAADVETILRIEDEAGRIYARAGLPPDLDGLACSEIEAALAAETVWMLTMGESQDIAFALCLPYEDTLHLRELNVLPEFMRRGFGARLLEHVCAAATTLGHGRVTLTTFRDIEWNAPWYAKRGFCVMPERALPPWLADIRQAESRGELSRWPRVAMMRDVIGVDTRAHARREK